MAQIFFGAQGKEVAADSSVLFGVFLNSDRQTINAIEGDIFISGDLTEVSAVNEADSVISLWLEPPTLLEDGRTIHFSGITPGGYSGDQGPLFTFAVQAGGAGSIRLSAENESLLLHDGLGTAAAVREASMVVSIVPLAQATVVPVEDNDSPEPFTPILAQDPNIFDGKPFVSFMTRDLLTGISHYEVREIPRWYSWKGWLKKHEWKMSKSPYVPEDTALESTILVKAVDRAGNEYIASLPPAHRISPMENGILLLSLFLLGLIGYIVWRKRGKRSL